MEPKRGKSFIKSEQKKPALNMSIRGSSNNSCPTGGGNGPKNVDYKLDFAYNHYLQSLMEMQIAQKVFAQQKANLNGQIEYQNRILNGKKKQKATLEFEMRLLNERAQIIRLLNKLEDNMKELTLSYEIHKTSQSLESILQFLREGCEKIVLKNIKKLDTEEEFDKLRNVLKGLLTNTEKLINSDRNFDRMHDIAEKIRVHNETKNRLIKEQSETYDWQKNAFYNILKNMSDMLVS